MEKLGTFGSVKKHEKTVKLEFSPKRRNSPMLLESVYWGSLGASRESKFFQAGELTLGVQQVFLMDGMVGNRGNQF